MVMTVFSAGPVNADGLMVEPSEVYPRSEVIITLDPPAPDGSLYYFQFGDGNTSGWVLSNSVGHSYTVGGNYSLVCRVETEGVSSTYHGSLVVGNRPPSLSVSTDTTTITVPHFIDVTAEDEDGDDVTVLYRIGLDGPEIMGVKRDTLPQGSVWRITLDALDPGEHLVTIVATDGVERSDETLLTFTVVPLEDDGILSVTLDVNPPELRVGASTAVTGILTRGGEPLEGGWINLTASPSGFSRNLVTDEEGMYSAFFSATEPGSYLIGVNATDGDGTHAVSSRALVVTEAPRPDISFPTSSFESILNEDYTVSIVTTVRNGGGAIGSCMIQVFEADDLTSPLDVTEVDLPPLSESVIDLTVHLDIGVHDLVLIADPGNTLLEVSEENNRVSGAVLVPQRYDLFVEDIVLSKQVPVEDEAVSISVTVGDRGGSYGKAWLSFSLEDMAAAGSELDIANVTITLEPVSDGPWETRTWIEANLPHGEGKLVITCGPKGGMELDPGDNTVTRSISVLSSAGDDVPDGTTIPGPDVLMSVMVVVLVSMRVSPVRKTIIRSSIVNQNDIQ